MNTATNDTRTYLVKLAADEAEQVRVWNGRKPMTIGHPARWSLEKVEGGVRVRSVDAAVNGQSRDVVLKDADIRDTAKLRLVKGADDRTGFALELSPVLSMESAVSQRLVAGTRLRIYHCRGEWSVDADTLTRKYVGRFEGKPAFVLTGNREGVFTAGSTVTLKSKVTGLEFTLGQAKHSLSLDRGESRVFTRDEAASLAISFLGSDWRLSPFEDSDTGGMFTAPLAVDQDAILYRKSLKAAGAAALVFTLLAIFWPQAEVKKEEKITILLRPKTVHGLMTAAPKGDRDAREFSLGDKGQKKHAGRAGGAHAKPVKTAKAAKRAKSPAPKAVARTAAPKAKPAQAANRKSTRVARSSHAAPAPVPRSKLLKTFSSASFKRLSQGLTSGSTASRAGTSDSAEEARSYGSARGTGGAGLGSASGVETRSATLASFGGGGSGDGGPGSRGAGYGRGSNAKVSGQGRSLISLDTGESEVDEGLTRDQVGRVIHAHMNEIRYCYDSAVLRSPDLEGRMVVKFSIGAPGEVRTAGLGSSTVEDRRLHECIVGHLKNWKFPKPRGGVNVAVSYPFMFKTLTR